MGDRARSRRFAAIVGVVQLATERPAWAHGIPEALFRVGVGLLLAPFWAYIVRWQIQLHLPEETRARTWSQTRWALLVGILWAIVGTNVVAEGAQSASLASRSRFLRFRS